MDSEKNNSEVFGFFTLNAVHAQVVWCSKTYDSLFRKWVSWCSEWESDPVSCPIGEVVNFLAHLFEQDYQYRSINAYRSAISSVHEKVDGYEVGQHPLVSRTLKGIFHERPPQPRYSETWNVAAVTTYIESLGENDSLSLAILTHKLVMLLALTRPSRSADLSQLDLKFRRFSLQSWQNNLAKQNQWQNSSSQPSIKVSYSAL